MVGRCLTDNAKKLVVVDLDGTLVHGNTLRVFIVHGMLRLLQKRRIINLIRVFLLLVCRRLRLLSHVRMKFGCLSLIDTEDDVLKRRFCNNINRRFNASVLSQIDDFKGNGYKILLATAAPDVYVPWIWDGDFVATQTYGNINRIECRGSIKIQRIANYMKAHGLEEISVAITDHIDDLAMVKAAGKALLVNAAPSFVTAAHMADVRFSQLKSHY